MEESSGRRVVSHAASGLVRTRVPVVSPCRSYGPPFSSAWRLEVSPDLASRSALLCCFRASGRTVGSIRVLDEMVVLVYKVHAYVNSSGAECGVFATDRENPYDAVSVFAVLENAMAVVGTSSGRPTADAPRPRTLEAETTPVMSLAVVVSATLGS